MPKHEALTPKAIANRIKAKGLQKLRWYCQMCQKQCRDENGFKCHLMSESHQRQLLIVAENPHQFVDGFSKEFLDDFTDMLRRQYGSRRVQATVVYNEYIHDKHHIHMNSTRWHTLTGFIKWLGREGICEVDHTEKGWFVKYIDRDPVAIWKQKTKEKMDLDDEERMAQFIDRQIEKAEAEQPMDEEGTDPVYTELVRSDEEDKVSFSLSGSKPKSMGESSSSGQNQEETATSDSREPKAEGDNSEGATQRTTEEFAKPKPPTSKMLMAPNVLKQAAAASSKSVKKEKDKLKEDRKRKPSALDEIRLMEESRKEKMNRKDYWLMKGIVVKVISKRLGDALYKKRGYVEDVKDHYTAHVRMLESNTLIKVDQAHLETVLPALGREVLVVNGAYRSLKAKLVSLDADNFCVSVEIAEGPTRGRVVDGVAYEDVCKIHTS